MKYKETTAIKKILALKKRLKIIQGGTAAGKTLGILLILIDRAQCEKDKIFSVVSESIPHLKRGAIRDFLNIMESHKYYQEDNWNKTDYIYRFITGSKMEFFSADNSDKVRGPRRNVLFINECNNINFDTYTQLAIRTEEEIYLDYNPVSQFWVHDEIISKMEHDFLILTYKDNEGLSKSIIKEIESRRENRVFWKIYGLGELSESEAKVYTGWKIIDEIPHEARLERYGLDFGYTNDPTAITAIYYYNGGWILDEECYLKGLSNKQIAETLRNLNPAIVIADSAEPKSIDEIRSYGINILPTKKGRDSVRSGIQLLQDQPISITKQSVNGIKEYRNYLWITDKNGKILNEPEKGNDHFLDASRYALETLGRVKQEVGYWDKVFSEELTGRPKYKILNKGL